MHSNCFNLEISDLSKKKVPSDAAEPIYSRVPQQGQAPFAAVLGCIDSRAPIEEIFDAEIGDLFVARVAGNTVNGDILGSIEYACKYAGSKLVLVLGHTQCGAVKGAYASLKDGNLTGLLERIEPAVAPVRETHGQRPRMKQLASLLQTTFSSFASESKEKAKS